ncbi:hypothetical protein CA12_39070 [Alienimonas californiensis]|uniref:Uncharacterized protein n=2 Tax=Alienimonas californiensis TaxID=2527989 RepID=A0A517PEG4_9PLAN|nr:hypothetical protein CA12_39070 [Alienimonas californiensis]
MIRSGTEERNLYYGRPVVAGRTIFVGLCQKYETHGQLPMPVFAVETDADGLNPSVRWTYDPDSVELGGRGRGDASFDGTQASVAVTDDAVFTLGKLGVLGAADRATGAERWRAGFFGYAALYASPVVHDDLLYVPIDDGLYVFEATAEAPRCIGSYELGIHYGTPLPTEDGVYVAEGNFMWKLKPPRALAGGGTGPRGD